jgi:hypothetical protein
MTSVPTPNPDYEPVKASPKAGGPAKKAGKAAAQKADAGRSDPWEVLGTE